MNVIRHLLTGSVALLLAGSSMLASAGSLPAPSGDVLLRIGGDIQRTNAGDEAHFDRAMLEALPRTNLATSTVVTDGTRHFQGFLMRDLLEEVGTSGESVTASALNDYVIEIPVEDFHRFDVLVADTMDGKRLTRRDKGPLWIVYPRDDHPELQDIRYDYRWVWQLERLEIR